MNEPAQTPQPPVAPSGLDSETVDRLNSTLASLSTTLNKTPPPKEEVDPDLSRLDPEVAQIVTRLVDKKINGLKNEYIGEQKNQAIHRYNEKISSEFPDLGNKSSALSKATVKEIQKRVAENPRYTEDTPSAVYDSACAAAIAIGYARPIPVVSNQPPAESHRFSTLTGGYMPHGSPPPPKTTQEEALTPQQEYFATKMGVPKEAYTKLEGIDEGNGKITLFPPKAK